MLGVLTSDQIESVLHAEIVARIGYVDRRGLPCIVPITYAYDGRAIYGYSVLGAKIESMSAKPRVCVEVDRVQGAADWSSVILRGIFRPARGRRRGQRRRADICAPTDAGLGDGRPGDGIADLRGSHGRHRHCVSYQHHGEARPLFDLQALTLTPCSSTLEFRRKRLRDSIAMGL